MQPQKGVTMVKEAGDLKGNIIKNKGGGISASRVWSAKSCHNGKKMKSRLNHGLYQQEFIVAIATTDFGEVVWVKNMR